MARKYLDSDGLSLLWTKIKTYITNAVKVTGVKGNAESTYKTGNVNLTADQVGAIPKNTTGNTQNLSRPLHLNGLGDNTLDSKINTLRANRLAFLPADQIIIEKTTDGGTTWVDAGIADSTKIGLFSETRAGVSIPLLNGVRSLNCGLRITITAMKYNVPSGTAETSKYNYWNSNYVTSTERYNQLKEMYFWVSSVSDTISIKVERATGAKPNNWSVIFEDTSWGATGWSGNDYVRFSGNTFGGGTTQTSNYWNYRITFMTRGANGGTTLATSYTTSPQSIMEIRGYGDTWWTAGNQYAANDKIFTHDYLKNVTFPNKVTATGGFSGNVTGTATNVTGTVAVANGGTGKTSGKDAANYFMNALDTGSSTPADADYYISQYVNGGTTTTTYHRRPMSALWEYIKSKISSILGLTATTYSGSAAKVNNHTVNSDVPSNAKFTDTVTTATTSGSGNAVTAITASNGALTVTKGTTFLTSHQDISGKADKSTTVSTVAYDSTNKKITKTINGTTSDVVTAATLKTAMGLDNAEANQNAFSNVKVGSTTVSADSKTDTLELVAGNNITLIPDATNDKVTISVTLPIWDGTVT